MNVYIAYLRREPHGNAPMREGSVTWNGNVATLSTQMGSGLLSRDVTIRIAVTGSRVSITLPDRPMLGGDSYDAFLRMVNHDLPRMLDRNTHALRALASLHGDPAAKAVIAQYSDR